MSLADPDTGPHQDDTVTCVYEDDEDDQLVLHRGATADQWVAIDTKQALTLEAWR